jgi:hypothetical protein
VHEKRPGDDALAGPFPLERPEAQVFNRRKVRETAFGAKSQNFAAAAGEPEDAD